MMPSQKSPIVDLANAFSALTMEVVRHLPGVAVVSGLTYMGCHLFTKINPIAGAIFSGSTYIANTFTKPLFKEIFETSNSSADSKKIGWALRYISNLSLGLFVAEQAGYAITAKAAMGAMLTTYIVLPIMIGGAVIFSLVFLVAVKKLIERV